MLNNPLALTDPLGLDCIYGSYVNGAVGEYMSSSGVYVVPGDCVSEDDNGVYVDGTVGYTNLDANGNLSYAFDPFSPGGPGVIIDSVPGFASWDWSQPDPTVEANILAISQALVPLNKLSDCSGAAVVHQIPLVPNKWLDKAFNVAPQPEEKTAAGRSIETADMAHKVVEFFSENKGPAKVVLGLNKAGLPALSAATQNGATKIVPKLASFASKIKGLGYGLTAVSATYETVSCYNKPGG